MHLLETQIYATMSTDHTRHSEPEPAADKRHCNMQRGVDRAEDESKDDDQPYERRLHAFWKAKVCVHLL